MKKVFLSMFVALMTATMSFAQNTLVAVLSHETNVQMFYGSSALVNAVEAAVSGDVITLSAGTFDKCDITKGITIRGVGAESDNVTILKDLKSATSGNFSIMVPQQDVNSFSMEGLKTNETIYINGTSTVFFSKCVINKISFNSTSSANLKMVNCSVSTLTLSGSSTLRLSNCRVSGFSNAVNMTSKADFFNCYVTQHGSSNYAYRCSFINCIFINTYWGGYTMQNDATAMNCLFIQNNALSGDGTRIDCYKATVPNVFVSYDKVDTDLRYGYFVNLPNTLQLIEEAKAAYLGTDGKEVGIYGGQYPYDLTPTYPRITTLNVAKQASADNKLSVEIEVTAAE